MRGRLFHEWVSRQMYCRSRIDHIGLTGGISASKRLRHVRFRRVTEQVTRRSQRLDGGSAQAAGHVRDDRRRAQGCPVACPRPPTADSSAPDRPQGRARADGRPCACDSVVLPTAGGPKISTIMSASPQSICQTSRRTARSTSSSGCSASPDDARARKGSAAGPRRCARRSPPELMSVSRRAAVSGSRRA